MTNPVTVGSVRFGNIVVAGMRFDGYIRGDPGKVWAAVCRQCHFAVQYQIRTNVREPVEAIQTLNILRLGLGDDAPAIPVQARLR